MKKLRIVAIVALFTMLSCDKDQTFLDENNNVENSDIELDFNSEDTLKLDFAKALAKALEQNVDLRKFLKNEALKMFDNDYDILYQQVKNERFSSGYTFRELILEHFETEERLLEIESEFPLLTIYVPELPNNSFSAAIWNTEVEIPAVAVKMNTTNHVPIINSLGEQYILKGGMIPSFPVLVIKNNERVVVNNGITKSIKGSVIEKNGSDFHFRFIDDSFNGLASNLNPKRTSTDFDQRIIDAYTIYKNVDGWQRDYVYYNLTPGNTKGQFSYSFQEHITTFSLNGNAESVYDKISDQTGDPTIIGARLGSTSSWTDGFFEFKITTLVNAKNGIGSEIVTYFTAKPEELFDLKYKKNKFIWMTIYTLESISLKEMNLNLPIFNWDLNQYASSIKVEIEEVDLSVTTVITDTRSVKFAANFAIDGGVLKKIGLKFGGSLEINTTQSIQKTFTEGNDPLGSLIVNFADNIIISSTSSGGGSDGGGSGDGGGPIPIDGDDVFTTPYNRKSAVTQYTTRQYSTGFFKLGLEPLRVE